MAYINNNNQILTQGMNNPQDEEDQKNGIKPLATSSSQPASISGGATAAPQQPKAPAASGMSSGFQNYVKANQGAAQNRLNQAAQQNVQNKANLATTGINQATTAFNQRMDQGSLNNRQNAVNDVSAITQSARNLTSNAPAAQSANTQKIEQAAPTQFADVTQATPGTNALNEDQTNRFKEVINARYKGPESLRQAGLYQDASTKVNDAQLALNQSQSAMGREALLRKMYEGRGDYNQGLNKLDAALLNSSQSGVKNLQNVAQTQGNITNKLDTAQIGSANSAQNRSNEINDIKQQAMDTFSTDKKAEEAGTESRLGDVLSHWNDLPDYYKNIIKNSGADNSKILEGNVNEFKVTNNFDKVQADYKTALSQQKQAERALAAARAQSSSANNGMPTNSPAVQQAQKVLNDLKASNSTVINQKKSLDTQLAGLQSKFNDNATVMNPFEAALLGVGSGEGLYKMGENAIKTATANKDQLVTKDEQLRQQALANLAGLDTSNQLDRNLMYGDASKAGTQSSLDALDLAGTRAAFNEAEQQFRKNSDEANLVGKGHAKVSRGNAFGKKTKNYYATAKGNAADMLTNAGYDFTAPEVQGQDPMYSKNLLKQAMDASQSSPDMTNNEINRQASNQELMGGIGGAASGAAIGAQFGGIGAVPGAIIGNALGEYTQTGTIDPLQNKIDLINGYAPVVGNGLQDIRSVIGSGVGSVLGKGIGGAIGGIDVNGMNKMGNADARRRANANLQKNFAGYLGGQGFDNRISVNNNEATDTRMEALKQLLSKMDRSNT